MKVQLQGVVLFAPGTGSLRERFDMATGGGDLMNAVVIGATGATGKCLVGSLLEAKVMGWHGWVCVCVLKLCRKLL